MAKKPGFGCMRLPLLNNDDRTAVDLETLNARPPTTFRVSSSTT